MPPASAQRGSLFRLSAPRWTKPIELRKRLRPAPPQTQRERRTGYRSGFQERGHAHIACSDALRERLHSWRRSCPRQQPRMKGTRESLTSEGSSVVEAHRAAARRRSDGRVGHRARQWASRPPSGDSMARKAVRDLMDDRETHSRRRSASQDVRRELARQKFRSRSDPHKSGSRQAHAPLRRCDARPHP